jgi:hypothetical protein
MAPNRRSWNAVLGSAGLTTLLLGSEARAQARVVSDLGTSTGQTLEARSSVDVALWRAVGQFDGAWFPTGAGGAQAWGSGAVGVSITRTTPLLVEPTVEGARWMGPGRLGSGYAAADLKLGLRQASGRGWLRVGSGGFWDNSGVRPLLLLGLGGSVTWQALGIELGVTELHVPPTLRITTVQSPPPPDTLAFPAPATERLVLPGRVWRELQAQVHWSVGPVVVRFTGGATVPQGTERATAWARGEATAWLTPQLGLVAALGTERLSVLGVRPPAGPFTLGLRAALGRSSASAPGTRGRGSDTREFQVLPGAGERHTLRIVVPHAHSVELTGDFLDWQVLRLTPRHGSAWETELAIPAGTYHVNIRIDGGPWVVPPGLAATVDDFGGGTGVLHVE